MSRIAVRIGHKIFQFPNLIKQPRITANTAALSHRDNLIEPRN